ncbi:hypothetical protein FHS83_000321 [Rhizomicrobium palustre]|uniref:Uncharacterized protein n=1 Tax=Rhizomicrobium palustre TaxID=189966 RepID=A0A846MUG9_9PROT|nr:DUF6615 family protein [Rhizomicrobium palustre]NIK87003.1 hypothetical protein [Rhizomicrobium palustre]
MFAELLKTLLELGHATSQNLEFAHQEDVHVSYGEETITETNLLELRRRNPEIIRLKTFTKKKESLIGADWEWHIIGRHRIFRMRIQAKRLQKNGILRIPHKIRSSEEEQIDLLIRGVKAAPDEPMPVYCFYTSNNQNNIWKVPPQQNGIIPFEYGCLLAPAEVVKLTMPKQLSDIEQQCIPWHYLLKPERYEFAKNVLMSERLEFIRAKSSLAPTAATAGEVTRQIIRQFPTIDELNTIPPPDRQLQGLKDRTPFAQAPFGEKAERHSEEFGVSKLLQTYVGDF